MALIGNYSVFTKNPGKLLAGSALAGASAAFTYGNFHKNGAFVNFAMQELDDVNYQVGFPWGYGGHGWKLPISAGAIHGHDDWQHIEISGSGYGVAARFGIGASTLTINADGTGSMVVPAVGGATLTIAGVGDIVATLLGEGSATISVIAEMVTGAAGWLVGELTISLDAEGVPMAQGWMEGTTDWPTEDFTTDDIAEAVWSYERA